MMKRIPLLLAIAGLLALFLPGCLDVRSHLTLNKDGSAEVEYVTLLDVAAMSQSPAAGMSKMPKMDPAVMGKQMVASMRKQMQDDGFTVSDANDGAKVGVKGVKHLKDATEIRNFLSKRMSIQEPEKAFVVKKGFFVTSYKLDAKTAGMGEAGNNPLMAGGMMQAMSGMSMSFTLTAPAKAKQTNAAKFSDHGRTMEWTITPGQSTSLQADINVVHLGNISLTILFLIFLLGVGGFVLSKGRKKTAVQLP